jgi:hypothetical protein
MPHPGTWILSGACSWGLPESLVGPLSQALESVHANIIKHGSLPPPVDWHPSKG